MPCERKHVEAIEEAVKQMDIMRESPNAHWTVEDVEDIVGAVYESLENALAACDESPCEWGRIGGDGPYHPSCLGDYPHVSWSVQSRSMMTCCPHCGRKIKDVMP